MDSPKTLCSLIHTSTPQNSHTKTPMHGEYGGDGEALVEDDCETDMELGDPRGEDDPAAVDAIHAAVDAILASLRVSNGSPYAAAFYCNVDA
ncbi:UNVERIFIED_CONTAM: hypothetical protein Sindi_1993600, partial [Sesamum indicum]